MSSKICVVGMGYVGLPLATAFSKEFEVVGFDINKKKIEDLKKGIDSTGELSKEGLSSVKIDFTAEPSKIKECDFVIVAVPTPIDEDKIPDLFCVKSASEIVGKNLKKGAIVVFDDIRLNDMFPVWESLNYDKVENTNPNHYSGFGFIKV